MKLVDWNKTDTEIRLKYTYQVMLYTFVRTDIIADTIIMTIFTPLVPALFLNNEVCSICKVKGEYNASGWSNLLGYKHIETKTNPLQYLGSACSTYYKRIKIQTYRIDHIVHLREIYRISVK